MCRKLLLFFVVCFVSVLVLASTASAGMVAQYEFEGDYSATVGTATGTTPSTTIKTMGTDYTYANGAAIVTDGTTIGTHSFGDVLRVSSDFVEADDTTTLDYVRIGDADIGGIGGGSTVTVAAWVKFYGTEFSNAIVNNAYDFRLYTGSGTGYEGVFQVANTVPTGSKVTSSANAFQDGGWHHIAGTYDGSYYRMYIDGQQDGAAVAATGTIPTDWAAPLTIAIRYTSGTAVDPGAAFDGWIDDVRIYDTAENLASIQSFSGVPEPTTVALMGLGGLFLLRRRR